MRNPASIQTNNETNIDETVTSLTEVISNIKVVRSFQISRRT